MLSKIVNFTDLEVWRRGHKLVIEIYKITREFPKSELFGLTDQMRRCSVSITSNIAEGFSRYSHKEKLQFFRISAGSITELQNQLIIARDVGLIKDFVFQSLYEQTIVVLKILNGLIRNTKSRFQIPNSRFKSP
jgi:four helix bundle protein